MSIKKRFASLFSKTSAKTTKEAKHHYKRGGFFNRKKLLFFPVKILVALLLLVLVGVVYAQAPAVQAAVDKMVRTVVTPFKPKPKPLVQSGQVLSAQAQAAIETLARQQLKQEQAQVTLPINVVSEIPGYGLLAPVNETIKDVFTRDPTGRARLLIKKNDRLIAKLQRLLLDDKSDQAITQAAGLIGQIGKNAGAVARNKAVLEDRELLGLQNAQYIRLQLILQQIEDTLPMQHYLTIEDARQKYLVKNAATLINSAPSPEAVFATGVEEVQNVIGEDFVELKAMEFIADFTGEVEGEAQEKLRGLEKELAVSFEKKMLKLPRDVRNRKLQSYVHYLFGDPLLQVRAFERMRDTLSDREVIMGMDSLQEVALEQVADRILQLDNQTGIDAYLDRVVSRPQDLKVLEEIEIAIDGGSDLDRIAQFATFKESLHRKMVVFLGSATKEQLETFLTPVKGAPAHLIDVVAADNVEAIAAASPNLGDEVKLRVRQAKQQTRDRFIAQLTDKEFLTQSQLSYNPVSQTADVRILLSHPQGIAILQNLKNQVSPRQRAAIDRAIGASGTMIAQHILFQVNDPRIFTDYQQFIVKNTQVNQILRRNGGRNFDANLTKRSEAVQKVKLAQQQQLYEVVQQITQSIFANRNVTQFEKQLPPTIVTEIRSLKRTLPARNIPKLTVPEGVTLSPIAVLPHDVQHAIVQAAKARIRENQKSGDVKLDLTVSAADLGIAQPRILPGTLLYPLKRFTRKVQLLLTFDSLSRAELLVKHNNERTLEAALLLEKNSTRGNINLALQTLALVQANFEMLRKNTAGKSLPRSERVDRLISAIIQNGIARQTVFASIEDKVYGADYVRVEKIRQEVLRNGVDTLLQLSGNSAQLLVDRLEQVVARVSGSKFKELKAIELLDEIRRFQPEEIDKILELSEIRLAKIFEAKLQAIDKSERERELLAYAAGLPGNPVRQYETYGKLRNYFEDKDLISFVDQLQSRAIHNFVEIVSGITDEITRKEFAAEVVGTKLQDLKIVVEAELQVQTPDTLDSVHTPIEQAIEEVKTIVEQTVVQELIENPSSLKDVSNQGETTVTDATIVQDLVQIIEQSPEATTKLIQTVEGLQQEVVNTVVATEPTSLVSQPVIEEQTLLQETIAQVQKEILTAPVSSPAPVEETLPQTVQTEIEAIKTEAATEEIPTVTTTSETTVTIESVQATTETQTQVAPTETTTAETQTTVTVKEPAPTPTTESAPAPAEVISEPAVGL